jgi:hypothetical protein
LTITDSEVRDNEATVDHAGGVFVDASLFLISGSRIVHNFSLGDGGGVYLRNSQGSIVRSLIQDNASGSGPLVGVAVAEPQILLDVGGGLYNDFATVTINDTAIVSNTATFGGGIGNGGVLTLNNVTISGNAARRDGGGLYILVPPPLASETAPAGSLGIYADLLHVTLAGNVADSDNTASGDGGGLFVTAPATASVHSTLLATNLDLGGQKPQCAGSVLSAGYNLLQSTAGCLITFTLGDQFNAPAGLLPLQYNGGGTLTHGLALDSLALNAADPDACLPRDQRGALRPTGSNCDVGAFEFAALYIPLIIR